MFLYHFTFWFNTHTHYLLLLLWWKNCFEANWVLLLLLLTRMMMRLLMLLIFPLREILLYAPSTQHDIHSSRWKVSSTSTTSNIAIIIIFWFTHNFSFNHIFIVKVKETQIDRASEMERVCVCVLYKTIVENQHRTKTNEWSKWNVKHNEMKQFIYCWCCCGCRCSCGCCTSFSWCKSNHSIYQLYKYEIEFEQLAIHSTIISIKMYWRFAFSSFVLFSSFASLSPSLPLISLVLLFGFC